MTLYHRAQPFTWGCMYHALYALLGDASVLDHVADVSELRYLVRLHALGYAPMTLFADRLTHTDASPEFWRRLRDAVPDACEGQACLVTIPGSSSGIWHTVAVLLTGPGVGTVLISDSACDAPFTLPFEEFAFSRYARAHLVETLVPADLDDYAAEHPSAVVEARHQARARELAGLYTL